MGLLDGLLGGIIGGGMAAVVKDVLEKHGGVAGVVNEFQTKGFGETVKSWVATGPNKAISPAEITQAFGADKLAEMAKKAGIPVDDLAKKLSEVLPTAIDKMTPDGALPKT